MDFSEWKKMFVGLDKFTECYEYIKFVIFELGMYKQYRDVAVNLQKYMKEIISDIDIDFQKKEIMIMINKEQSNNTILLTSEI